MVNDFSSLFEIFLAIHIGGWYYDAVKGNYKDIPNEINEFAGLSNRETASKVENLKARLMIQKSEIENSELQNILQKISHRYEIQNMVINQKYAVDFIPTFNAIYFITLFYTFFILLIGAFEQFYSEKSINMLLSYLNLELLVIVGLFIRSFIPKYSNKRLNPIYIAILFISPFLLYTLFLLDFQLFQLFEVFSFKVNIILSIFISLSMLSLLLIRYNLKKYRIRKYLLKNYEKTVKEVDFILESIS